MPWRAPPLTPLFALLLGAGPEAVGLVVGASTVTGIFLKLPAGALSDIFGRRTLLLSGLLFFALPPFGYLLIETYWQLLVLRFVHGLATAIYSPVAMAVVVDIARGYKGGWLSWFSSLTTVGGLLGPPLGGFLLSVLEPSGSSLYEFRVAYLVCGGFGVFAFLTAWLSFPPSPRKQRISEQPSLASIWRQFHRGVGEIIADRRVVVASNMEGIQNLSLGALEAFLPVYAVTQVGLSEFDVGLLWAVQIGVTILAKPIMGGISDRWGRKPIITSGMMLCAVSLFWIPHMHTFSGLLGLAIVFGGGEAFVTSSAAALVADLCEARSYGAAMGVFGTTSMHAAALFAVLGEEKAKAFFEGFAANGGKILSSNGEVRRRVAAGEFAVGITDTDDANVARLEGKSIGMVYPDADGMGTLIIPNCAVLIASGPNPDAGRRFIDYLLRPETERALAESEAAQMPLRPGVPVPQGVTTVDHLRPMEVNYVTLASLLEDLSRGYLKDWVDRNG